MSEEDNYFGNSSPARSKLKMSTIERRIKAVDPSFIPLFAASDLSTQRILALAAAMAIDRLLFEMTYEVLRDHVIMGTAGYTEKDLSRFFEVKKRQSETVGAWTEETVRRLIRTYRSMMAEAGLTDKGREKREIYPALLPSSVEDWMEDHRMGAIKKH